ncbi:unnamed protein product [Rotaria sp. Silwood2]|nr:unnamed protein product [Rotaria sp. Silwood2]CAF3134842.1 unnamed protein product [Rotaria sp. Silwood2]CAF3405531.1 unnamed protein product [Rotaria sp. Silwood2]CAF3463615.1 unnamed protein product [Rotaria sp. Silwood2]CAF4230966.1 unnamed protein product [Rotaria sp. Silwood2]
MSEGSGYQGKDRQSRGKSPSGKPGQHFHHSPSRAKAKDNAQNASGGNQPVHHTAHEPGQLPHFHPADRAGNIKKDGSHYTYPK